MCTPTILAATATVATTAATIDRIGKGKPLIGSDILPRPPKPPVITPPKDTSTAEKQARFREIQRRLKGRPGAGRKATIFSQQGTGTGSPLLKTKTGQ